MMVCFGSMKIATTSLSSTASKIQHGKSPAWMSDDRDPVYHNHECKFYFPLPLLWLQVLEQRLFTVTSHWSPSPKVTFLSKCFLPLSPSKFLDAHANKLKFKSWQRSTSTLTYCFCLALLSFLSMRLFLIYFYHKTFYSVSLRHCCSWWRPSFNLEKSSSMSAAHYKFVINHFLFHNNCYCRMSFEMKKV